MPAPEIVAEHNKTHLPYRSWCKHCVQGRGVGPQHYAAKEESSVPRIGLDYFYLTKGGVKMLKELSHEELAQLGPQGGVGCWDSCIERRVPTRG